VVLRGGVVGGDGVACGVLRVGVPGCKLIGGG
jgi:hypothetical protein